MAYFLMIVCVITCTIQSPFKKLYQKKTNKGTFLFVSMITLAAACFFAGACVFQGFHFEWAALPYSLLFAFALAVCNVTSVLALRYGSLALTSLISSYSLMIPTVYGFLRFGEHVYVSQLIGLALLVVSLYMTNMAKKQPAPAAGESAAQEKKEKKNSFTLWLIMAVAMALSNAMCTIVQREEQVRFNGAYKNEFMLIALLISFTVMLIVGLVRERRDLKTVMKLGALPAVLTGAANGATNLLVMVVTATIATSIFYPVISGGGMVLAYVISVTLFKEKFTTMQKIGILLGVASLLFLNIPFGDLGPIV
jgi:drug/metabolite transporter (DMT)-like permease